MFEPLKVRIRCDLDQQHQPKWGPKQTFSSIKTLKECQKPLLIRIRCNFRDSLRANTFLDMNEARNCTKWKMSIECYIDQKVYKLLKR